MFRCKCPSDTVMQHGLRLACLRSMASLAARRAMAKTWSRNAYKPTPCGRRRCEIDSQMREFRRLLLAR